MKRLIAGLIIAGVGVFAGCTTLVALPPVDSRVTIAADVCRDVYVRDVRCVKGTSDFMTVQANIVSVCEDPVAVDWKVVWLDAAGMEIESLVSTWNSLVVHPMDVRGLQNTAPRSDAVTMRIYIRRSK